MGINLCRFWVNAVGKDCSNLELKLPCLLIKKNLISLKLFLQNFNYKKEFLEFAKFWNYNLIFESPLRTSFCFSSFPYSAYNIPWAFPMKCTKKMPFTVNITNHFSDNIYIEKLILFLYWPGQVSLN